MSLGVVIHLQFGIMSSQRPKIQGAGNRDLKSVPSLYINAYVDLSFHAGNSLALVEIISQSKYQGKVSRLVRLVKADNCPVFAEY